MAIQRLVAVVLGKLVEYVPIIASAGAGSSGAVIAANASGLVDPTFLQPTATTSAGVADAGKTVVSNSSGKVDTTFLPYAQTSTSGGASDAGKLILTNGSGKLDSTVLPTGIGADTSAMTASEALTAGALVSVWSNAGTQNARNADGSTTGKEAVGFVLASVAQGSTATVYFAGQITGLTGLTAGPVFLSDTTPGGITATPPTTAGHICQQVGTAISATVVDFGKYPSIQRA